MLTLIFTIILNGSCWYLNYPIKVQPINTEHRVGTESPWRCATLGQSMSFVRALVWNKDPLFSLTERYLYSPYINVLDLIIYSDDVSGSSHVCSEVSNSTQSHSSPVKRLGGKGALCMEQSVFHGSFPWLWFDFVCQCLGGSWQPFDPD